ncbi:MAG: mono/diheme cytochrome c family protein [Myxococcota bacterium]|jgi:mono/diheme cytochrome c family protein
MRWSILFLLVGCGTDRVEAILALEGDVAEGASVYSTQCSGCHGADGEGGVGPAMDALVPAHTDTQFIDVVLYGIGDEMPTHDHLSDQRIADLLAWARDTYGEN